MAAAKHAAIHDTHDSGKATRIHTAIRQKSAAYTPLFNKCQRHTHRYLTNVSGIHRYSTKFSGIHTAIRQMSAVYTPPVDKSQRQSRPLYSARRQAGVLHQILPRGPYTGCRGGPWNK